jgi:DNA adenine methylase
MMAPLRPVLRWHGGKWTLAPWIIAHMPKHRVYVEPFGGAASVLLRKPRAYAEVYNDLDDDVVNLFQVLRGPRADDLVQALRLTPFAATEFFESYLTADDKVERARRLVVRSFMGFGSNATHRKSGFRSNSNRSGTTPARDWHSYPEKLGGIIDRLRGVTILNRPAVEVMAAHDAPEALHYVDPPYVFSTRTDARADYAHELSDDKHRDLLAFLRTLQGKVILSGYRSPLYDAALPDWYRVQREHLADGARKRIEVLWMNFAPPVQEGFL